MRIEDFIQETNRLFNLTTGDNAEIFKLGIYAFEQLKRNLGTSTDDNFLNLPSTLVDIELRAIPVDRLIIEWGDGTKPFECIESGIATGSITPQIAFDDWKAQNNYSNSVATPQTSFTAPVGGNYHVTGGMSHPSQTQYPHVYAPIWGPTSPDPMSDYLDKLAKPKSACSHDWKRYQGLSKVDYTCSKCQERRDSITASN